MADYAKDVPAALEKEIENLKKELAEVTKTLSARASSAKDDADDAIETLRNRAARAASRARQETHSFAEAAREHPQAAAAVGGSVGLVGFVLGAVVGALVATSCTRR